MDRNRATTFIQIYAPCNDSYTEEKDNLFSQLSDTMAVVNESDNFVVMGNFNRRVRQRRTLWEDYPGPHNDITAECNYNRQILLELCAEQGLYITNIFYKHRKRWNNVDQCSQTDYN